MMLIMVMYINVIQVGADDVTHGYEHEYGLVIQDEGNHGYEAN